MSCRLCGAVATLAFVTTDRNRALTAERFSYWRCTACGAYSLANAPVDLGVYYPPDYYELPELVDLERAANVEVPKLALIGEHVSRGRLVEIGPGAGAFSFAARRAGFDVTAIEMDARCCTYLEQVVGITAIQSSAPDQALATIERADVIALWHVVEHLLEPWAVLTAAAERLKPGGLVAIAVPNPQALQFRMLRGRWAHVDAPRHVHLIPAAAMTEQLERLGLRVLELTTSDPAGRAWNRFGWQYALRRFPARHPATVAIRIASTVVELVASPWERRGLNGATYTVIAEKPRR
jgi:2-polyprenyl-3-methyl-5-hydroxy-6-metoxy-1,4-benzoquinol methylase